MYGKKVMSKVIGKCQHVSVEGQQIMDDLLFLGRDGVLCKLEKNYDYVDRGFIDYMLATMSFRKKWRKRINSCITTSPVVIMNGSPSFFKAFGVLKQGDLLSPLLLIITMEVLNKLLMKERAMAGIIGLKVGEGVLINEITHLFFVAFSFLKKNTYFLLRILDVCRTIRKCTT